MFRIGIIAAGLFGLISTALWADTSHAQTTAATTVKGNRTIAQNQPARAAIAPLLRGQNKVDANAGTVTVMTTRNLGAPFMRAALNLSTLLDAGERFEKMRVVPVVARGKVQNLWDILYLKGVDLGFVQTDILQFLKGDPRLNSIKNRIRYITVMFPEEVHIVAHKSIKSLKDLNGKRVSINARGTGSSIVGTLLFRRLGIKAITEHEDTGRAIARIKRGELFAHFNVLGKPARPVLRIKGEGKLHLLPIPYSKEVRDVYFPSRLSHKDYPNLIAAGEEIETIAAGNVLAVFNWAEDTERYRKVARFVEAFFSRFEELKQPGFHPKWKDVNLAAAVPGWTRFKAAQQWLDRNKNKLAQPAAKTGQSKLRNEFYTFLKAQGLARNARRSASEMRVMFEQFLRWRQAQAQ